MKTSAPEKVQLVFTRREAPLAVDLPPGISIDGAATYVLSYLSQRTQRDIVSLVASDSNGALKVPQDKDTYVAKTKEGYGVIYQTNAGHKTILHVVHPNELDRFKTELQ